MAQGNVFKNIELFHVFFMLKITNIEVRPKFAGKKIYI